MAAWPSVRGGLATALYPFSRRVSFDTGISFQCDGSEQRKKTRAPLFEFDFTYNALPAVDVSTLLTFHSNSHGMLASDISLTVNGTTWNNLAMQADSFASELAELGDIRTVIMKAVQTQNGGYTIPSVSAVWPTFSTGAKFQYPVSSAWRSLTAQGSSPTGKRYGYGFWGTGVAKQPTRQLGKWEVNFIFPDADAVTFETFFLGMQGRLTSFSFPDPFTGTNYPKARFSSDVLELNYRDIGRIACKIGVEETN